MRKMFDLNRDEKLSKFERVAEEKACELVEEEGLNQANYEEYVEE